MDATWSNIDTMHQPSCIKQACHMSCHSKSVAYNKQNIVVKRYYFKYNRYNSPLIYMAVQTFMACFLYIMQIVQTGFSILDEHCRDVPFFLENIYNMSNPIYP